MDLAGWSQFVLFAVVLTAITPALGGYLHSVFSRESGPLERGALRLLGVAPDAQGWKAYARSVLVLLVVALTVFIGGLLIGRTPEYVGRKLDARLVRLVVIATIAAPMLALAATGLAVVTGYGRASVYNGGPQGFAEILYAYVSQTMNNGSAFAGYTGYLQPEGSTEGSFGISSANVGGGLAMLAGRYVPLILALAVAGAIARRPLMAAGRGTIRTDTATFVGLVLAVVVAVVLLTFVPALLLGSGVQGLGDRLF